jgi:hypothetical protein
LAWDTHHWIYLLDRAGKRQAQWHTPDKLVSACCADDGSAYGAVGNRGEVWWLAPDLMPRWERAVAHPATAAAMDSLGQYLAVADVRGNLHLFDLTGRLIWQVESPRPLHHLAFVPSGSQLVGSADYGLVACFDPAGRLLWRDGLVAHIGSLAVTGDGSQVVLACFSEGLERYSAGGEKQSRIVLAEPSRLACVTFDGRHFLVAGLSNQLRLMERDGRTLATQDLDHPAAALALGALGDRAVVAVMEGPVIGLGLPEVKG